MWVELIEIKDKTNEQNIRSGTNQKYNWKNIYII